MGEAPGSLVYLAIACSIAWYVGRHIIYFGFTLMYALFASPAHGHSFAHAPPESQILAGEQVIGIVCAWFIAGMAAVRTLYNLSTREREPNPLATTNWLLAIMAFPIMRSILGVVFFVVVLPLAFLLAPLYVVLLALLTIVRLLGGRRHLAAYLADRSADVIDISRTSPWRGAPRLDHS